MPLCLLSPCRLPCTRVEALAAGAAGGAGVRKPKQSPWLSVFKTLNAFRVKGAPWVYHKSDHAIDDCLRHLGCLESTVGSLALTDTSQAPLEATSVAFVQDVAQTAVRPVHRMDDDVRVAVVGIRGRAKVPQGGRPQSTWTAARASGVYAPEFQFVVVVEGVIATMLP